MSYTNETAYLKLPQYIGTDVPSILVDFNGAMEKIDTAALQSNENVTKAVQNADQAKSLASAASAQSEANANSIGTLGTRVKALEDTSGSSESEIAQVRQVAENAQNTANAAQTAARNAQTAAGNAQSTANNNTAQINGLSQRVGALEGGGGGGDFYAIGMDDYRVGGSVKNFLGKASIFCAPCAHAGEGDATLIGVMSLEGTFEPASNIQGKTIDGSSCFPICEVDGNPFEVSSYAGFNRTLYAKSYPPGHTAIPDSNYTIMALEMVYDQSVNKTYLVTRNSDTNSWVNRRFLAGDPVVINLIGKVFD